jgi:hypothetical protein
MLLETSCGQWPGATEQRRPNTIAKVAMIREAPFSFRGLTETLYEAGEGGLFGCDARRDAPNPVMTLKNKAGRFGEGVRDRREKSYPFVPSILKKTLD